MRVIEKYQEKIERKTLDFKKREDLYHFQVFVNFYMAILFIDIV